VASTSLAFNPHKYKRIGLIYLAGYLCGGGFGFALMPRLALKLMFSNGDYGEVFPRFAGMMVLALGLIVVQILRKEIYALYRTLIFVRLGLCTAWVVLFTLFRDPFFLTLLGMVGFGVLLSIVGGELDERAALEKRA
jgi:uncharacterized protein YjeT (DUF2065 family)